MAPPALLLRPPAHDPPAHDPPAHDQPWRPQRLRPLPRQRAIGDGLERVRVMRLLGSAAAPLEVQAIVHERPLHCPRLRARVLRRSMAAFKSLEKRAKLWFPRYTWPLYGEALLLHSYEEHVLRRPPSHASICAALNHAAPAWRLVAQRSGREGYATHTDHGRCVREMTARCPRASADCSPSRRLSTPVLRSFLPSFSPNSRATQSWPSRWASSGSG